MRSVHLADILAALRVVIAPSKLVSSGHLWQRYGREAFGLTKTYTVSWTFHDKEQVHLEFAAVLTDHCKEIISEVVEVLLGDNTELSLRKEVLRIEFRAWQAKTEALQNCR